MVAVTTQFRTKLAQYLPPLLGKPIQLMPFSIHKHLITQVLQRVFKEALDAGDMDFLVGQFLRFEIEDCKLVWTYTVKHQSLQMVDNEQANASIRCNIREFVLLANRRVDPDTLFFQRRLIIEGDTELGLTMKNLMDALEPKNLPLPLLKCLQMMEYLLVPEQDLDNPLETAT